MLLFKQMQGRYKWKPYFIIIDIIIIIIISSSSSIKVTAAWRVRGCSARVGLLVTNWCVLGTWVTKIINSTSSVGSKFP